MLLNIGIGALIFGYAGWAIVRFVKNSKKGKCAGCAIENTCKQETKC